LQPPRRHRFSPAPDRRPPIRRPVPILLSRRSRPAIQAFARPAHRKAAVSSVKSPRERVSRPPKDSCPSPTGNVVWRPGQAKNEKKLCPRS
jgi:hypothetical protein